MSLDKNVANSPEEACSLCLDFFLEGVVLFSRSVDGGEEAGKEQDLTATLNLGSDLGS